MSILFAGATVAEVKMNNAAANTISNCFFAVFEFPIISVLVKLKCVESIEKISLLLII